MEKDIVEFEKSGFYMDKDYNCSSYACENALPDDLGYIYRTKKFNARLVDSTELAYKFKTKKAFFWIAKSLVYEINKVKGTIRFWEGAQITWLKR